MCILWCPTIILLVDIHLSQTLHCNLRAFSSLCTYPRCWIRRALLVKFAPHVPHGLTSVLILSARFCEVQDAIWQLFRSKRWQQSPRWCAESCRLTQINLQPVCGVVCSGGDKKSVLLLGLEPEREIFGFAEDHSQPQRQMLPTVKSHRGSSWNQPEMMSDLKVTLHSVYIRWFHLVHRNFWPVRKDLKSVKKLLRVGGEIPFVCLIS